MSTKKILIIEDDRSLIKLLRESLESNLYKIYVASDGSEGIRRCYQVAPDLIILDILLPGKSGFEVLKKLKQDKISSSIPVIILSNLGQEQEIETGLKLGAKDYLVKTDFTIYEVIKKVKKALSKK